ncbi:hypothetical protein ACFSC4_05710 [Deinococcus malanensis]|uniref:hypothetical protein n=1 Tax=Deinococcus malanensis TaxID=1706855 RepID=UPI0036282646
MSSPPTLTFLGTADSKGVPRFWCECAVCADARAGGVNRRTRTGLLLRGAGRRCCLTPARTFMPSSRAFLRRWCRTLY